MAVSREPGQRSKVAVRSRDENIDAKGSCVGPRGQRVQEIMNELGGEKIDIVDWNEEPAFFLSEALQPAKATRVPNNQLSLAIGNKGQNAKLAARLTGFRIDIKKESDDVSENAQKMIDKFEVVDEEGEN